jgi:hypothetical protein
MRKVLGLALVLVLAGCGVPRSAGQFALRQEGLAAGVADDDASIRAALAGQADAWISMEQFMRQRQPGGTAVKADFAALVEQAAALARREKALIDAGEDDPAANRRALAAMRKMWGDVRAYLGK